MSKNKYFFLSMFLTLVLSAILILLSTYVKKVSKTFSTFKEMSLLISNNTDINFINDTLLFGQSIIKEFNENQIDTNCQKIFFKNNSPSKIELNNFLFFYFNTIKEFSATFYDYTTTKNKTKFSIILSCSDDIIITFEIIKTKNTTQIKNINGIGKFIKKICPILIAKNHND